MSEWQISIRPTVGIEHDPHGSIVASFYASTPSIWASGQIGRGPKGLDLAQFDMESSNWDGMDAQTVQGFPVGQILAAASETLGLPLVEVPPDRCPCGHH